jgi:20S proteasome alpha/beta subunit
MTLTVCLQGKDGLVLASDSRGTFGDVRGVTAQNDTIKKIYMVRNIGILSAGGQQGNMIIEEVARIAESENINDATQVMEKVREVGRRKFNEWFPTFPFLPIPGQNAAFMRPTLQLTIAGYDLENGNFIPRMYSMVSNLDFSPNLHDFGFALGGVAQYALYLLNRLYSADMGIEDLKHLAAYVVTETATQDGKVGGPVQMAVILPKVGASMVNREEVTSIVMKNEKRSKGLKSLFRKGK